jgi:DNA helicase-2/ATP-dependent DNA helicase PcrA
LFVGITRAKEELELSMAVHRDYRGQRRMSVPSQFLMELPRNEMRVVKPRFVVPAEMLDDIPADNFSPEDPVFSRPEEPSLAVEAEVRIGTAADLAGDAAPALPPLSPDVFHQGMVVRHPDYGLGKIVALSGAGVRRMATVAFASQAGQKKFMLQQSPLRPAKTGA